MALFGRASGRAKNTGCAVQSIQIQLTGGYSREYGNIVPI